jgi:MFS family permease
VIGVPAPLRRPDFRGMWLAGLISDGGDWMLLVALPTLVYQLTGSTLGTAVAFLAELAPPILLGSVAGRLADRWDRRRLLLWVSSVQALAVLPLLLVQGRGDLWIVYLVITVQASLATFFEPARNAVLPALVPAGELVSANSLLGVNTNLGRLVGGPLGGALLAFGDLEVVVVVDALSFVAAALMVARVRVPPVATGAAVPTAPTVAPARAGGVATTGAPVPPPAGAGPAAERDRGPLRAILGVAATAAVAQGLFVVLFVPFVIRGLHGGASEVGLLRGVQAIGALAAGAVLGVAGARLRPAALAAAGAAAFGVLSLAVWNAPALTVATPLYVGLFIAVGAPGIVMVTGLVSVLQGAVPQAAMGRAFGAVGVATAAGQAAGILAAGVLGDRVGLAPLLDFQGSLYLLAGAIALLTVARRRRPGPPRPVWELVRSRAHGAESRPWKRPASSSSGSRSSSDCSG